MLSLPVESGLLALSSLIIYMCLDDPHRRTKSSSDQVKEEKDISSRMLNSLVFTKARDPDAKFVCG